ncbi:MAG: PIN domain-containing protein [Actinomycetota bacterium]
MIVDTGILYALADRDDRHYRAARRVFALLEPKVVPEPVVVETDWLILDHLGVDAEIAFLTGLAAGEFAVEPCTRADRERAAQLVAQYRDARIGYVDAVTVAMAERLDECRIATLDRRHFGMIRPRHRNAFEILP